MFRKRLECVNLCLWKETAILRDCLPPISSYVEDHRTQLWTQCALNLESAFLLAPEFETCKRQRLLYQSLHVAAHHLIDSPSDYLKRNCDSSSTIATRLRRKSLCLRAVRRSPS